MEPRQRMYGVVCVGPTGERTVIPWLVFTCEDEAFFAAIKRQTEVDVPQGEPPPFTHHYAEVEEAPDARTPAARYREVSR